MSSKPKTSSITSWWCQMQSDSPKTVAFLLDPQGEVLRRVSYVTSSGSRKSIHLNSPISCLSGLLIKPEKTYQTSTWTLMTSDGTKSEIILLRNMVPTVSETLEVSSHTSPNS